MSGSNKNSRGFYFAIDALFAVSLLLIAAVAIPMIYITEKPILDLHHESQDFVMALSELKLSEVNDTNPVVQQLIASGKITNLNKSILQQIGDFWAAGQDECAENLTKAFGLGLFP
ncbi:hypothetical protein KY316_02550, partial [Candidatus Woesearchaeota archaeon]|nr:hypothetical protein [Candidatus Woesearchaeota archaeon]